MSNLEPQRDSPALRYFLEQFKLTPASEPRTLLSQVARAFASIPYENLTKIVKRDVEGSARSALRSPAEVLQDHVATGAGGTCFSLTATLLHLVRALGFEADVLLADRAYGANTHCALRVLLEGEPHLLDPGFLIVEPLLLVDAGQTRVETSFNELLFTPRDGGARLDLETVDGNRRVKRLTFKTDPADQLEISKAWEASFDWDMMRYPLLTRVREQDGAQVYLQGTRLQIRARRGLERREIPVDALPGLIEQEFGIRSGLAATAMAVLTRQGELRAGAFGR